MTDQANASSKPDDGWIAEHSLIPLTIFVILFLIVVIVFMLVLIQIGAWGPQYLPAWTALKDIAQNILASAIGVSFAYVAFRHVSERRQKNLVKEGLDASFDDVMSEVTALRRVIIDNADWKQTIMPLQNIPYPRLFRELKHLGMLVQGWDKWPLERRYEIAPFVKAGGKITVILHNPENPDLLKAHRARLEGKDCYGEIVKTVKNFKLVAESAVEFIQVDDILWYFLLRFDYERPEDRVYIISPYAHKTYPVIFIPAFILRREYFPEATRFLDEEWDKFVGIGGRENG